MKIAVVDTKENDKQVGLYDSWQDAFEDDNFNSVDNRYNKRFQLRCISRDRKDGMTLAEVKHLMQTKKDLYPIHNTHDLLYHYMDQIMDFNRSSNYDQFIVRTVYYINNVVSEYSLYNPVETMIRTLPQILELMIDEKYFKEKINDQDRACKFYGEDKDFVLPRIIFDKYINIYPEELGKLRTSRFVEPA